MHDAAGMPRQRAGQAAADDLVGARVAPTRICASRRALSARRSPGATTTTRQGCSRLAALAASIESSSSASVVGCDDQGQHPAERDRAALFAQRDDLLVDDVGRGVGQVDDHGRLHSRPERRNISKAESGPQLPASYGSGLPCDAQ